MKSTTYQSAAAALAHLHTHISCPSPGLSRPNDDPCFAWVKETSLNLGSQSAVYSQIEAFIQILVGVRKLLREVHYLVATAVKHRADDPEIRPFLPRSLVCAFQDLISVYIIAAKQCLVRNRLHASDTASKPRYQARSDELMSLLFKRLHELQGQLEGAKQDIIISGTRNPDGIGVRSIGAPFLALSLMRVTQDRPIDPRNPEHGGTVELFEDYFYKLSFEAIRRPRRRIFLDVREFEEEVDALWLIMDEQHSLIVALLENQRHEWTNMSRLQSLPIELRVGERQLRKLRDRMDRLDKLWERSSRLKAQIKQSLEVLDEGYGKTMRVFTVVTLFFLPM